MFEKFLKRLNEISTKLLPSPLIPKICFNWLAAIINPDAVMNPEITGCERKFVINPSFKIPITSKIKPDSVANIIEIDTNSGLPGIANLLQAAQDSIFTFEDIPMTRSSNTLTDVVEGASIDLMATSASNVRLTINNDVSTLKTNIKEMITSYNDLLSLFEEYTSVDETTDESGALSEDGSTIRFIKNRLRDAIFGESSTPSGTTSSLRDIGISVNQYGAITFTEATYDSAISSNYDDVVTMLTADTNNQNLYDATNNVIIIAV